MFTWFLSFELLSQALHPHASSFHSCLLHLPFFIITINLVRFATIGSLSLHPRGLPFASTPHKNKSVFMKRCKNKLEWNRSQLACQMRNWIFNLVIYRPLGTMEECHMPLIYINMICPSQCISCHFGH